MRLAIQLPAAFFLMCFWFTPNAFASVCNSEKPDYPWCYNIISDFDLCLRAARWTGSTFVWKGTPASNGFVKEAKRRGLDCTEDINFPEYNSKPYRPTQAELDAANDVERQALNKKREKAASLQAQIENQNRYDKRLKKDRCLLEISERFPKQSQNQADYFCELISEIDGNEIFLNCMMDKGANKSRRLVEAAVNVCADIAVNPSATDFLKYNIPSWLYPTGKN